MSSSTLMATVTVHSTTLVRPCAPTPTDTLPLSPFDKLQALLVMFDALWVYDKGHEPAKVIRAALSKALVPYHPLAGRLVESESGDLEIACTRDGVWFAEASADCRLREWNIPNQLNPMISEDSLLPPPRPNLVPDDALLLMQVTRFTCGGFAVGVSFNHVVIDGTGLAQFMRAVGEMARGLNRPTVEPVWCRDVFTVSPTRSSASPPAAPAQLKSLTINIPQVSIDELINEASKETGRRYSSFDVLAAKLWQCRTRAMRSDPNDTVRLRFSASARPLLQHVLPSGIGYYGNCIFPLDVDGASGRIAEASIGEVVEMIQAAKGRLSSEFGKWVRGELRDEPYHTDSFVAMMVAADVRKVGLSEVDFGLGDLVGAWMVLSRLKSPTCLICPSFASSNGSRLMTMCVKGEHMESFRDEMGKWTAVGDGDGIDLRLNNRFKILTRL